MQSDNSTRRSTTGPTAELAPTGIAGLDIILGGGLPRDRLYLVQGDPGAGKTTLALQFLLEGHRLGEPGLYVTLGETRAEIDAVARSHGWSLDGIDVLEISTVEPEETLHEDETYDVFHPAEVELAQIIQTMLREAERVKPMRVVIDSLSEVRLLARDPLRYRRQLLGLKHYFVGRGCTILLLDAQSEVKIGDLQSNTLVHGVISLEQSLPAFGVKRRRMNIVKLRGVRFDDGYHDFRIETGGLEVYPRLVASQYDGDGVIEQVISSGLTELDQLLGGGLSRGTSTILMGEAGVGKSTLASRYVTAAAERGEKAAIFTFDENQNTFVARAEALGMKMRRNIERKNIMIHRVDPGELAPGQFADMVRHAVEDDGANIVVIDSLNGYLNATPDERFLIIQLHELLTFLGNKGVCTILVVAQHGLAAQGLETPMDVSYLADSVLLLRYFEHAGHVRKAISVLKKRTGAHETTIRELQITPQGIRVGEPLKEFQGVLTGTPAYTGGRGPLFGGGGGDKRADAL